MKSINKYLSIFLIILLALLVNRCETKERFYRPDVPQKLCTVGIFDIDDTIIYDFVNYWQGDDDTLVFARYISFEKSFQFEFPEEVNDSLRGLTFRISNENEDIFIYQSNHTTKNLELILPERLRFESGMKYFLYASEEETPNISAETRVPSPPPTLSLLSVKTDLITLDKPIPYNCLGEWPYAINTEIEFSFLNNNPNLFYAILLIGSVSDSLHQYPYFLQQGSGLLDFSVLETNTDGFLYTFQGRKTVRSVCPTSNSIDFRFDPTVAYFIDGSKIPGSYCTIKILTQYQNGTTIPHFCRSFLIRLISIPEELYLFEKSLFTYMKVFDDPFSEPVTLKGNIKGGNGIFAICRSKELLVYSNFDDI